MNFTFRLLTFSFLLISVLIGSPNKVRGQEVMDERNAILSFANTIYGSDDRLLNGKYYSPKHFFAEGHPYFIAKEWIPSTIFIKGIQYDNVPLKYNIEDEKIIINAIYERKISREIVLNNSFIDSLVIGSHIFHNTDNFIDGNPIGMAELVYKGNILVYFKHSVEFIYELSVQTKYGKYAKAKRKIFLFSDNSFNQVQKKKEFLTYFPEHKKEINLFLRKETIKLRNATNGQLHDLLQFCEQF